MNEAIAKQKVSTKKMNATNARGLNAMKQKIKRNNRDHQTEIDKYREDKFEYLMSEEEEETEPVPKLKKPKAVYFEGLDAGDDEGFSTVGRGGKTLQYTPESILKHLRSIVESRGKKNTDRAEQIRIMEKLLEVADTPYREIRVLLTLISTRFDLTTGSTATFMAQENWKSAEHEFSKLLETLEANRNMVVVENAEEWEDDEKPPQPAPGETLKIPGSVVSVVERLDDELTRSLQHIDPHTAEYIERLRDEQALYNNILRALLYVENMKKDTKLDQSEDGANRVVMRRLEHVYFKVCLLYWNYVTILTALLACTSSLCSRRDRLENDTVQAKLGNNTSRGRLRYRFSCSDAQYPSLQAERRHHPSEGLSLPSLLSCAS